MKITNILLENVGNIRKLNLDFTKLPNGLIALSGKNGSGKTTFLASLFEVPLSRRIVFYNKYIQDFFDKAGKVQTSFELDGKTYTSVIQGKEGKSPSCVLYEGDTALGGSKDGIRDYDAIIKSICPSIDLVLASRTSTQNNIKGFFGLSKEERHATFSSMIGTTNIDKEIETIKLQIRDLKSKLKISNVDTDIINQYNQANEEILVIEDARRCLLLELEELRNSQEYIQLESLREKLQGINNDIELCERYHSKLEKLEYPPNQSNLDAMQLKYDHARAIFIQSEIKIDELKKKMAKEWEKWSWPHRRLEATLETLEEKEQENWTLKNGLNGVDLGQKMCQDCSLVEACNVALEDLIKQREKYEECKRDIEALSQERADEDLQDKYIQAVTDNIWAIETMDRVAPHIKNMKQMIQNAPVTSLSVLKSSYDQVVTEIKELERLDGQLRELTDRCAESDKKLNSLEDFVKRVEKSVEYNLVLQKEANEGIEKLDLLGELLRVIQSSKREIISYVNPIIEDVANAMLVHCFDGAFSIKLHTEQANKISKQLKEDFDPTIINNFSGKILRAVSGGEQTFVSEALRMGFTLANGDLTGNKGGTLTRDESIANVDLGRVDEYINLLREGQKLGQFDQVILVAHNDKLIQSCDAILRMNDGSLDIDEV